MTPDAGQRVYLLVFFGSSWHRAQQKTWEVVVACAYGVAGMVLLLTLHASRGNYVATVFSRFLPLKFDTRKMVKFSVKDKDCTRSINTDHAAVGLSQCHHVRDAFHVRAKNLLLSATDNGAARQF